MVIAERSGPEPPPPSPPLMEGDSNRSLKCSEGMNLPIPYCILYDPNLVSISNTQSQTAPWLEIGKEEAREGNTLSRRINEMGVKLRCEAHDWNWRRKECNWEFFTPRTVGSTAQLRSFWWNTAFISNTNAESIKLSDVIDARSTLFYMQCSKYWTVFSQEIRGLGLLSVQIVITA